MTVSSEMYTRYLLLQVREQVDDSACQEDLARVQEVQSSVNQVGLDTNYELLFHHIPCVQWCILHPGTLSQRQALHGVVLICLASSSLQAVGRLLDDVRELAEALGGVEERLAAAAASHATLEASVASVQHAVDDHSAAAGQLAAEVEALRQQMARRAADQDQVAARVQSTADAVSALTVS